MSTADRTDASAPAASDVARACREAGLVRLVGTADGDALAAVGVLARALRAAEIPFQASVATVPHVSNETDADATVTVGVEGGDVALTDTAASVSAYATARELGDAEPVLALAGVVAAGETPGDHPDLLEDAGLTRRPGVAVPTADLAEGLAHSTLFHAPFSGDMAAASTALADLELPDDPADTDRRRLASFLSLSVVREGPTRAAAAVQRALRPYVGGPFETVGGFADVLDAVARERPGTGVALALGHDATAPALDAWRTHATRAHETVANSDTGRYDGLFVVRGDGPVGTVARLVRDYRSPEPVVLALGDDEMAVAADRAVTRPLRTALSELADDASVAGRGTTAYARLDSDVDRTELVTAFRGAL